MCFYSLDVFLQSECVFTVWMCFTVWMWFYSLDVFLQSGCVAPGYYLMRDKAQHISTRLFEITLKGETNISKFYFIFIKRLFGMDIG